MHRLPAVLPGRRYFPLTKKESRKPSPEVTPNTLAQRTRQTSSSSSDIQKVVKRNLDKKE